MLFRSCVRYLPDPTSRNDTCAIRLSSVDLSFDPRQWSNISVTVPLLLDIAHNNVG